MDANYGPTIAFRTPYNCNKHLQLQHCRPLVDTNFITSVTEVTSTTSNFSPTAASVGLHHDLKSRTTLVAQVAESSREFRRWSRDERRRRRRATEKYRHAHASRERTRVEAFNVAFGQLRQLLPTLPPDKKLSKIEILRLAICYIAYLNHVLDSQ